MEYKNASWALVARGAVCGALAWLVVLLVTWLSVVGPTSAGSPAMVVALVLDAHYPFAPGPVTTLDPLTWFELPAATLFLFGPTLLATAGVIAGRLTKTARLRTGTLAGATVSLGYTPLLALAVALLDAGVELLLVAAGVTLVFGILGGVVGVRT